MRLSPVLLVRHHSDDAEADTIHVSSLLIPSVCVRRDETSVYTESRHDEARVAVRSLPTVNVAAKRGRGATINETQCAVSEAFVAS